MKNMEDVDFGFYVTVFVTSVLLVLLFLKLAITRRLSKPNLPPGPWKLPVIGNLHQLVDPLPHHRMRDLARKHGDLMHLQLGELSHIVVSSAEVVREMMMTHHDVNFSQRPRMLSVTFYDFKGLSFAPYGDYWRRLRKIFTQELLSSARVQSYQSIRKEEVSSLIEQLHSSQGTPVNLSQKLQSAVFGITAITAFGKKCKDQEAFITSVRDGVKHAGGFSVAELFPSRYWIQWVTGFWPIYYKHLNRIDGILQDIVENRRAERAVSRAEESSGGNTLLDVLLDIQEEKANLAVQLDNQGLRATLLDAFVAGSDTTATTLEWAMFELSRNPKAMGKAQTEVRRVFGGVGEIDETRLHELNYLKCVIKETLRLRPPAPLLVPRESGESCVISGYHIPGKTKIIVNAWAIGRDPRYWSDPEKFHPERFLGNGVDFKGKNCELVPFGAGRRMCPGMSFAVANLEHTLAHLLFHFDWKLPNGVDQAYTNGDVIECFGVTAFPKDDVYLIPVPRSI